MKRILLAGILALLSIAALPATDAGAHTARHVGGYGLEIGWGAEPAYTGFPNSVQLLLHDRNELPVADLGDTLRVEVATAGQKRTFGLEREAPGDYRAFLIPTAPGNYTFRFFGTIRGVRVDLSVTSGPTTFSAVENADQVQFPAKVPGGAELAGRIEREVPRLEAKIAAARKEAGDDASAARVFGMIGIALAAIGLAIGALAVTRKR